MAERITLRRLELVTSNFNLEKNSTSHFDTLTVYDAEDGYRIEIDGALVHVTHEKHPDRAMVLGIDKMRYGIRATPEPRALLDFPDVEDEPPTKQERVSQTTLAPVEPPPAPSAPTTPRPTSFVPPTKPKGPRR
jgi:hypothetical protein